jgi:hypothetical protein
MQPTRIDILVDWCLAHGTPKQRAATRGQLKGSLSWGRQVGGLILVSNPAGELQALGLGWPVDAEAVTAGGDPCAARDPSSSTFYVANLVSRTPGALRQVLGEAKRRWPWIRHWLGHRVPKAQRHDPQQPGTVTTYPAGARERLGRLTEALCVADVPEAGRLPALPAAGGTAGDGLLEPSPRGVGVLGVLS